MRVAAVAAVVVLSQLPAFGAEPPAPQAVRLERAGSSPAVRDLPAVDTRPIISHKIKREGDPKRVHVQVRNPAVDRSDPHATPDRDAALWEGPLGNAPQETDALQPGGVQFDGLSNQDNFDEFGFRVSPPDTNHDVGPSHVVETTNLLVRIYDKAGNPLTDPFRMSALFGALGAPCSTNDDGDPIVLYDPLADRWLLSQFTFEGNAKNRFCIGISKTPDPTGEYWVYQLVSPIQAFQDYPHYGVWPDGYYISSNMFNTALTQFVGAGAFALEREAMLDGSAATAIFYDLGPVDSFLYGMLPSDLDGPLEPPAGAPNVFAYFASNEYSDPSGDALRLFDFHPDYDTPASSTFTERSESPVTVAAFNPLHPTGRRDVLQKSVAPGTASCTNAVDSLADTLMYRLQYRRLCDRTERLVVNHTVNANGKTVCSTASEADTYEAGVRVYELRRTTGAANSFAVANQVTYSPGTTSRWMGSAALDQQGNLAVSYAASSLSVSPSVRATGRLVSDAANTLPQGEITLVTGTGMQTNTSFNRWGDYSNLAVDPVDECTFWFSQEYYTVAGQTSSEVGWSTRIGSFRFSECAEQIFCTDFEAGGTGDWSNSTAP